MPFSGGQSSMLAWSAVTGTTGAILSSGVISVEAFPDAERLGAAGMMVVAAYFLIRWFMAELKKERELARLDREGFDKRSLQDRELFEKRIGEKDQRIAAMAAEHIAALERHSASMAAEIRSYASAKEANTIALNNLTEQLIDLGLPRGRDGRDGRDGRAGVDRPR